MKLLVINGPNLDMLGVREPGVYGSDSLDQIIDYTNSVIETYSSLWTQKVQIDWFQSNSEGELVSRIGMASKQKYDGVIINPAAYTHTSVAIFDALKILDCPVVEVHLSNTNSREGFRKNKITTGAAKFVIEGAGKHVYSIAVISLILEK